MNPASWFDSRDWLAAGWTMLHFLWIGGLAGLLAAALLAALSRSGPRVRYAAALGMLLAITAIPPGLFAIGRAQFDGTRPLATDGLEDATADRSASASASTVTEELPTPQAETGRGPSRPPAPAAEAATGWLTLAYRGLPWFWIVGSPLTFVILTCGLYGAERLRRSAQLLEEGEIADACRRLRSKLRIGRNVALAVCERVAVPVLVGIVRPLILLPPAILTGCSAAQIEMILIHELAHVRRQDLLVNLIQRLIEAALFFHPVIWWLSRRVRLEREQCCDAVVLELTGAPQAYAETLAAIALPGLGAPQAAIAFTDGHLVIRIRHILDLEEKTMNVSRKALLTVAGLAVLAAGIAPWQFRPLHSSDAAGESAIDPGRMAATNPDLNDDLSDRDEAPANSIVITIHADEQGQITSVHLGPGKAFVGPPNDFNLRELDRQLRSLMATGNAPRDLVIRFAPQLRYQDLTKVIEVGTRQQSPDGKRLQRITLAERSGPSPAASLDAPQNDRRREAKTADVQRRARSGTPNDPKYVVEPPDVLSIDVSTTVRSADYKLVPGDELLIRGAQLLPIDPKGDPVLNQFKQINRPFAVQPDGTVDLGPEYDSVGVAGMTIQEAKEVLIRHLRDAIGLRDPKIAVSYPNVNVPQTVRGERPVRPDGTISLGSCGTLYVAGMRLEEAQSALEQHLSQFFHQPIVTVRVTGMNSKQVYLIRKTGKKETVAEITLTGRESVVDVLSQSGAVTELASQRIWVARPDPKGNEPEILPVNWTDIATKANTSTNYYLLPHDRIFVE